jgi:hypothetical protein
MVVPETLDSLASNDINIANLLIAQECILQHRNNEQHMNDIEEERKKYEENVLLMHMNENKEQLECVEEMIKCIKEYKEGKQSNRESRLYFLEGAGGCGKTFVYSTLVHWCRSQNANVIAVASSGIASLLLPDGSTGHSRFKIPLEIRSDSMCNISRNSLLATQIRKTKLIIWDEAVMVHRYVYEALDRTLQDIMGDTACFGGIPILLGGDWRQILPVVKRATKSDQFAATLKASALWTNVTIFTLIKNMRVEGKDSESEEYRQLLLRIGN